MLHKKTNSSFLSLVSTMRGRRRFWNRPKPGTKNTKIRKICPMSLFNVSADHFNVLFSSKQFFFKIFFSSRFVKNYKGVNLSKITTTVGLNIGKIDTNGVRLNFWDLGGQEELQALWDKYYQVING